MSTSAERVCVVRQSDIDATYSLLVSYINDPQLSASITKFIINTDAWRVRSIYETLRTPDISEDAHPAVEAYIRTLGLSEKLTGEILTSLHWKKEHLMGREPELPQGINPADRRHTVFNPRNREYAHTATALLLSLCKNITTIQLNDIDRESTLSSYLLHNNYGKLPTQALQHLSHVHLASAESNFLRDDGYEEIDFLEVLRYFHRLPALRSLTMDGVMEYQHTERALFPAGTASLSTLSIRHADISSSLLGTLIRAPKALEHFTLQLGGGSHPDGGHSHIRNKTLGKCLLEQRSSLQVLDLMLNECIPVESSRPPPGQPRSEEEDRPDGSEMDELDGGEDELYENQTDYWYWIDHAAGTGPRHAEDLPDTRFYGFGIGSLHDFAALTHLSLDVKLLLGPSLRDRDHPGGASSELTWEPPYRLVDALPPGLVSLTLYDYVEGENTLVDEQIAELMAKKAERLPKLEEVRGVREKVTGVDWEDEEEEEDDEEEDVSST